MVRKQLVFIHCEEIIQVVFEGILGYDAESLALGVETLTTRAVFETSVPVLLVDEALIVRFDFREKQEKADSFFEPFSDEAEYRLQVV